MLQRRLRSTPILHILLLVLGSSFAVACGGGSAQATPTAAAKATAPAAGPTATRPALPTPSPQAQPAAQPKPSPAAAAKPSPSSGQEYTVAEGDTMARIAQRFYDDPTEWRRIYDANKDAIGDDPDSIKIGTKLRIPPRP